MNAVRSLCNDTCQLCAKKGGKLVDSHIIPESMYGSALRDVDGPPRLMSAALDYRPKRRPKGVYDQIVCEGCEARFSPWDDYAYQLLFKANPTATIAKDGERCLVYQNVDYVKLKLFFISLLWRMHASAQDPFKDVQLGSFAGVASRMIRDGDPGSAHDFAVLLYRFEGVPSEGYVRVGACTSGGGRSAYSICFASHVAIIKVDARTYVPPLSEAILTEAKPLLMAVLPFEKTMEMRYVLGAVAANLTKK